MTFVCSLGEKEFSHLVKHQDLSLLGSSAIDLGDIKGDSVTILLWKELWGSATLTKEISTNQFAQIAEKLIPETYKSCWVTDPNNYKTAFADYRLLQNSNVLTRHPRDELCLNSTFSHGKTQNSHFCFCASSSSATVEVMGMLL